MIRRPFKFQQQRGAALIVGLVLMVLITALAISGMNTATTEQLAQMVVVAMLRA